MTDDLPIISRSAAVHETSTLSRQIKNVMKSRNNQGQFCRVDFLKDFKWGEDERMAVVVIKGLMNVKRKLRGRKFSLYVYFNPTSIRHQVVVATGGDKSALCDRLVRASFNDLKRAKIRNLLIYELWFPILSATEDIYSENSPRREFSLGTMAQEYRREHNDAISKAVHWKELTIP